MARLQLLSSVPVQPCLTFLSNRGRLLRQQGLAGCGRHKAELLEESGASDRRVSAAQHPTGLLKPVCITDGSTAKVLSQRITADSTSRTLWVGSGGSVDKWYLHSHLHSSISVQKLAWSDGC